LEHVWIVGHTFSLIFTLSIRRKRMHCSQCVENSVPVNTEHIFYVE